MRCKACDVILSDKESSLKSLITDEYFQLCSYCLSDIEEDIIADGDWNLYDDYYEEQDEDE